MIPSNIPVKLQSYLRIIHLKLQTQYSTTQISIRGATINQIAAKVFWSPRYLGNIRIDFRYFLHVVQRTGNVRIALSSHMSVYHRHIHVFMAHEFLDRSDIMPRFQKMRGEVLP
jgi:hypothetical protein